MQSYVGDDGCLHLVAERGKLRESLARVDLPRARLLNRLSLFWLRRVRCPVRPSCAAKKNLCTYHNQLLYTKPY